MTIIKQIENWFKAAVANPTDDNRRVQLGCHLEEVDEMMQESYTSPKETLEDIIIDESNGRISVSTLAFDLKTDSLIK